MEYSAPRTALHPLQCYKAFFCPLNSQNQFALGIGSMVPFRTYKTNGKKEYSASEIQNRSQPPPVIRTLKPSYEGAHVRNTKASHQPSPTSHQLLLLDISSFCFTFHYWPPNGDLGSEIYMTLQVQCFYLNEPVSTEKRTTT
ncbi:uncharacterized protein WM277_021021 [Molossus nigricans]